MGKIENMTYAYVNITSLETLTRNLLSKTYKIKEYNMMLVQVAFRRCLLLILANLEVVAYQFMSFEIAILPSPLTLPFLLLPKVIESKPPF